MKYDRARSSAIFNWSLGEEGWLSGSHLLLSPDEAKACIQQFWTRFDHASSLAYIMFGQRSNYIYPSIRSVHMSIIRDIESWELTAEGIFRIVIFINLNINRCNDLLGQGRAIENRRHNGSKMDHLKNSKTTKPFLAPFFFLNSIHPRMSGLSLPVP